MSETPAVYGQTQSRRRFAKSDENGSSLPRARAEPQKNQGDPEGESGSPCGLLVSRCEVPLCGGYAARTDLPRSLAMA